MPAAKPHPAVQPYRPLRKLADGLHCVEGSFGRSPLGRRMTVLGLASGRVALHSPIRMEEGDMASLEALGGVAAIIAPNSFHTSDTPWYSERYPDALVLAPTKTVKKLSGRCRFNGALERDWPEEVAASVEMLPLEGLRHGEAAFLHRSTRTLVLTDLVFNLGAGHTGLTRLLLKLNNAHGRFGPTRLMRLFTRDKAALLESVRFLQGWDFDRVIVSHGDVVENGGKALMRQAFEPWGV